MSSETRDPRGAVLDAIIDEALDEYDEHDAYICKLDELLARLDAADPVRKLWPEVLEALEHAASHLAEGAVTDYDVGTGQGWPRDEWSHDALSLAGRINRILTRAQALTPARETKDDAPHELG